RDHFTALNRSLQILRAAEGHPAAMMTFGQAFAAFKALWHRDGLRAHFLEEETDLVPVLRQRGAGDLADRLLHEHDGLRGQFDSLDPGSQAHAVATAKALTAHARWEEDVVFQWLQQTLDEAELEGLLRRSQGFRRANGLPVNPPRP
ncbi:MAG TPA: hemerythrin domain-containing protein, partial [Candidatus Thermoplasmatota archaeon]|nr:hemerythrin domain-containing protein [Candidatus Thermoplasmatota archaeon]